MHQCITNLSRSWGVQYTALGQHEAHPPLWQSLSLVTQDTCKKITLILDLRLYDELTHCIFSSRVVLLF